jgi:hypothetical protein
MRLSLYGNPYFMGPMYVVIIIMMAICLFKMRRAGKMKAHYRTLLWSQICLLLNVVFCGTVYALGIRPCSLAGLFFFFWVGVLWPFLLCC